MTIWQAASLGLIQGLTEFLPISSSGHLALLQQFFNLRENILFFDTALHLATLMAIIIFFWRDLWHLRRREVIALIAGTIPAVFVGLLLKDWLETLFSTGFFVAITLLITGFINWWTDRHLSNQSGDQTISWRQGLIVGVFQALAIVPGISRSGSTLAGGAKIGFDRQQAFRFSFLLAIPAIAGAGLLQIFDLISAKQPLVFSVDLLIGGLSALLSGLASLIFFRYIIGRARLEVFAWYCWLLGGSVLLINLLAIL